jgi:hypothetical protein
MYLDKYMIAASPALYLLVALGLFSIRKLVPLFASLAALTAMLIPGLFYYYRVDVKEQWDEVAEYIMENSDGEEVVVFAPNFGDIIPQRSFTWYYPDPFRPCGLGDESGFLDQDDIPKDLMKCVSGYDHFWVIESHQSGDMNHFRFFFQDPNQANMRMLEEQHFVYDIRLYLFELTD